MRSLSDHPIAAIQWLPVDGLIGNAWNPNVVISTEMRLLKTSILRQGWLQPVLVSHEVEDGQDRYVIIDGFHRSTLAKADKEVRAMTQGLVPCAVLDLPRSERIMLTVRINRAKGSHVALKMHELVRELITVEGLSAEEVCVGIGASKHEVETLMTENLFKKLNVETTPYSMAWEPIGKSST